MPQPAIVGQLHDPLLKAYADAWERVLQEEVALRDNPQQAARARRLAEMRARIEADMADLDTATAAWLKEQLPEIYKLGAAAGVVNQGQFLFTAIHSTAVENLAGNMFDTLLAATRHVTDTTKQLIRSIAQSESLQKAIEGRTATQAALQMRRVLEQNAIHSVTYANGTRQGLAAYTNMVVRSQTAVAYNLGTLNSAEERGTKFFEVLDGPSCGWTAHDDPDEANGKIVERDDALTWPTGHPNCRRAFGPRPDVKTNADAKKAEGSSRQRAAEEARVSATQPPRPPEAAPAELEIPSAHQTILDQHQRTVDQHPGNTAD